ncbi:MAG: NUDIX domain-containing protein [Rickettsiales bacterium]|nr:NUDIX domain-containing protein [Rickettsiales bacterium]
MQAYCLITDGVDCLVPKKAIENDLWSGEKSAIGPVLVNQPGQYALFGGKVEAGEHARESAQREVLEESGVDISSMSPVVTEIAEKPGMYKCYAVIVSPEQLVELRQQMSENIARKNVKDGEMSSVDAVPLERVRNYLGVDQKPSLTPKQQQQYAKSEAKRPGRHSIDWYGEMASATLRKNDEIQVAAAAHSESIEREKSDSPVSVATLPHVIEGNDDVAMSSEEKVRTKLREHLYKTIPAHQGDLQTRDELANVIADMVVEELSKDKKMLDAAAGSPELLHSSVDNHILSAKSDHFLKEHYHNADKDIGKEFRAQQYQGSGRSISEYVVTQINHTFRSGVKSPSPMTNSMVERLVGSAESTKVRVEAGGAKKYVAKGVAASKFGR